jgi:DNA-binding response OmpR family regulator
VLVVDDEAQILRALRINLTAQGCEVRTATDGAGDRPVVDRPARSGRLPLVR